MNGPIDIFHNGEPIGPGPRKFPEGEHCRLPDQQTVRVAFMAVQQGLRQLQGMPQPLLSASTFPFVDSPGHATVDDAIALLEREVATLKTLRQNYRASKWWIAGTDA